jgi:hypothetical protein
MVLFVCEGLFKLNYWKNIKIVKRYLKLFSFNFFRLFSQLDLQKLLRIVRRGLVSVF